MTQISSTQLKIEMIYDYLENLLIPINEQISEEEIKIAYRNLAKKYHPDYYKAEDNNQIFDIIQKSYDYLIDNIDYIEEKKSLIIKYDTFLKEEEKRINPKGKNLFGIKTDERNRINNISVKGAKNVENKIKLWLSREFEWLAEEKAEWENIYIPILKNEVTQINNKLNEDIDFLNQQIDINQSNKTKQSELIESRSIKKATQEEFLFEVKEQIKIKTLHLEQREMKLKELDFISNDINMDEPNLFALFAEAYFAVIKNYFVEIINKDKKNSFEIVSILCDEDLKIRKTRF